MGWVTIKEATKILEKSRRSIWRMIEDGSLQSKKEDSIRYILIPDETAPKPAPNIEQKKNVNGTLLKLALMEELHNLHMMIGDKTREMAFSAQLYGGLPDSDGDRDQKKTHEWAGIYIKTQKIYEDIQKGGLATDELYAIFSILLKIQSQIKALLQDKLLEIMSYEDLASDEIDRSLKSIKIERDHLMGQFEAVLSLFKDFVASHETG